MNAEKHAFFDENREDLWKKIPLSTPLSIGIDPSTVCNFRCKYCAHALAYDDYYKRYGRPEIMPLSTFEMIVSQLHDFPESIKKVHLECKGEPLCNTNIATMVKLLKDSGRVESVQIISNGSLLDERLADDLLSAGLDVLCVSMQGMSIQKYQEICGWGEDGDFERLFDRLKYFYDRKGDNCQLFIKNIDIALSGEEEKRFYDTFSPICDRIFVERITNLFSAIDYSNIIEKDASINKYGENKVFSRVCNQPFSFICIFPNGEVRPCTNIDAPTILGNVKNETLYDIWNGKKRKSYLQFHLEGNRLMHKVCKECERPNENMRPEDRLDDHADWLLQKLFKNQ